MTQQRLTLPFSVENLERLLAKRAVITFITRGGIEIPYKGHVVWSKLCYPFHIWVDSVNTTRSYTLEGSYYPASASNHDQDLLNLAYTLPVEEAKPAKVKSKRLVVTGITQNAYNSCRGDSICLLETFIGKPVVGLLFRRTTATDNEQLYIVELSKGHYDTCLPSYVTLGEKPNA